MRRFVSFDFTCLTLAILMLYSLMIPNVSRATPIGSGSATLDLSPTLGSTQIMFSLSFGSGVSDFWDGIAVPGSVLLFEDLILEENDDGQIFSVDSGANFDKAVNFLTNGLNDIVGYGFRFPTTGGGVTVAVYEAGFFYGDHTGAGGIDFEGYDIDAIELVIDEITFGSGSDSTILDFTLNLNQIPEPSSILLASLGFIGLTALKRKLLK